jgi:DNA-directed RNA polymerase specialized sigma24 family protein
MTPEALAAQGHTLEAQAVALLSPKEAAFVLTQTHLRYGHSAPWAKIRTLERPDVRQLCDQADAIWWRLATLHTETVRRHAYALARKTGCDRGDALGWAWMGAYAGARRWRPEAGSLVVAIRAWIRSWVMGCLAEERADLTGCAHHRTRAIVGRALRLDAPVYADSKEMLLDRLGVGADQERRLGAKRQIQRALAACSPGRAEVLLAMADGATSYEIAEARGCSHQAVSELARLGRAAARVRAEVLVRAIGASE